MAPFLDTRPGVAADQRYKSFGGNPPYALTSADGISWRVLSEGAVLPKPRFAVTFWDVNRQQYVAYARAMRDGFKHMALVTSDDYLHWSEPANLDFGNAPHEHLYWNTAIPYFRAPHLYLGFPLRLTYRGGAGGQQKSPPTDFRTMKDKEDRTDTVLMSSRDGYFFGRRFMEAFLRPGPDPRNWRPHVNQMALGMLPLNKNEISMYYTDNSRLPTVNLRRLVLRTDGFVSLNAFYSGGEFTTKPLTFSGDRLVLNVATSAAGRLRVEIQGPDGKPLDGHRLEDCPEIYCDQIEHVVRFTGGSDLSALAGKPVRLRFEMHDADLYSLRFAPAEEDTTSGASDN